MNPGPPQTPPKPEPDSIEVNKTYRIEHLPGLDVVVNLDYPEQKDVNDILDLLKSGNFGVRDLPYEIGQLHEENDPFPRFFVKVKRDPMGQVDFIRGRTSGDTLCVVPLDDFRDKRSRYAFVGLENEIILSKKIREIIASDEVQELAKKYGFYGMIFPQPVMAMILKKSSTTKGVKRYLIYKNVEISKVLPYDFFGVAKDLRNIFFKNGIHPHDLKQASFITTQKDSRKYLVLLDIEAYTEMNKSVN